MAGQIPVNERRKPLIAPSLLSADPLAIGRSVSALENNYDWLHLDVMDGHFVPNLSYGPSLVSACRRGFPEAFLDVHLMTEPPESFVELFATTGADVLTVHVEATPHLHRVLQRIRDLGCRPGVSINPATPVEWLKPILHMVDLVLVMSVNPGFGGQAFIPETLEKAKDLYRWRVARKLDFLIEMDGGLGPSNAGDVFRSGCDVIVAGNAIFGSEDPVAAIESIRNICREEEQHEQR